MKRPSESYEASSVVMTMKLCERFHLTPAELGEIDYQTIQDWLTILHYEAEIAEQK